MINLADNLLKVNPTAMGLSPPSSLESAIRFAPKKVFLTWLGTFPGKMISFIKVTRVFTNFVAGSPRAFPHISLRCCGRNPSGPPAAPFLKEKIALVRFSVLVCKRVI